LSDETGNGGFVPPEDRDVDPGRPVRGLGELEIEPSAGFLHRLRNKIERRSATSQFLSVTWYLPKLVLLEFVTIVFYFLRPADDGEGDKP
jgi:hypothetical protein